MFLLKWDTDNQVLDLLSWERDLMGEQSLLYSRGRKQKTTLARCDDCQSSVSIWLTSESPKRHSKARCICEGDSRRTEKARSTLTWVATAHEPGSNFNRRWERRKSDDLWNSFCFQSAQMWANSLTLLQPHLDRCSRHHAFLLIMLGSALISEQEQTLPLLSCFLPGIWLKQWER